MNLEFVFRRHIVLRNGILGHFCLRSQATPTQYKACNKKDPWYEEWSNWQLVDYPWGPSLTKYPYLRWHLFIVKLWFSMEIKTKAPFKFLVRNIHHRYEKNKIEDIRALYYFRICFQAAHCTLAWKKVCFENVQLFEHGNASMHICIGLTLRHGLNTEVGNVFKSLLVCQRYLNSVLQLFNFMPCSRIFDNITF